MLVLGALDVDTITFDVVRFNIDTGDIRGGDVDNGVPGNDGDALLLRDIGGLEDHNLEDELSLEQAGIFLVQCFAFENPVQELRIKRSSRSVEVLVSRTHISVLGNNCRLFQ